MGEEEQHQSTECFLCNSSQSYLYNDEGIKIFKWEGKLVIFHEFHGKYNLEQFEKMRDLILDYGKERWGDYNFIQNKNMFGEHCSLVLKEIKMFVNDNVKDKFCPLIKEKCVGSSCIYHCSNEILIEGDTFITHDCLVKLEKSNLNKPQTLSDK